MAVLCVLATLALFAALVVVHRRQGRELNPPVMVPPPGAMTVLLPRGNTFHVVGESHYQRALEVIAGGRTEKGVRMEVTTTLKREPRNRHDTNAVAVFIDGRQVGYLSREDAVTFQPLLTAMEAHGEVTTCTGVVVGGWDRGAGDRGAFGVRLLVCHPDDVPTEDQLVDRAVEKMRTTKSSAGRRNALKAAMDGVTTEESRRELLLQASAMEVDATLEKVAALKTPAVKRRRLEEALAALREDAVPDELQQQQVARLEAALRELDMPSAKAKTEDT